MYPWLYKRISSAKDAINPETANFDALQTIVYINGGQNLHLQRSLYRLGAHQMQQNLSKNGFFLA